MADNSHLLAPMDSEKPAVKKERLFSRFLYNDKLPPVLTFFSAVIAFSLSLVALLSGAEKGQLQDYEVVILNTSTILQNAIKVERAASVTARAILPLASSTPTPVLDARQLSLPGISAISSFFSSVGSDLTPQATASTGSGSSSGGSPSGSALLGDLESFITDVFGNVTTSAAQDVADIANTLVGDVTSALGVKQWYALYMTELCSGYYEPSYSTPGASRNTTSCTQLNKLKLANQTNSTLQLGNTVLDFSAVNIPNKLGKAGGALSTVIEAIIVLQIIGIVFTGLLIVLTPLNLFISFFRKWWFTIIVASLTFLATGCFVFVTALETAIHVAVDALVEEVMDGLGVEAYGGTDLLVILWIKFVFMVTSSTVWFLSWHNARYVVRERVERRPVVVTASSTYPRPMERIATGERVETTI
ncbi:hypothetical protein N431DRAFT_551069 [Stipitochalara longipes BDJ]|nr:hypothetical protein N431DRAFT_551069 [Stipitochalara longipes BDJ]